MRRGRVLGQSPGCSGQLGTALRHAAAWCPDGTAKKKGPTGTSWCGPEYDSLQTSDVLFLVGLVKSFWPDMQTTRYAVSEGQPPPSKLIRGHYERPLELEL